MSRGKNNSGGGNGNNVNKTDAYSKLTVVNNNSQDTFSAVKNKGIEYDFDYTTCLHFTATEGTCLKKQVYMIKV